MEVDWRGILSKCSHLFPELFGGAHQQKVEYKPKDDEEVEEEKRPLWSRTPENEKFEQENVKMSEVSAVITCLNDESSAEGGIEETESGNSQQEECLGALEVRSKVVEQPSHSNLDYAQIQEELEGHQTRRKLLLLQALRWMLT